jgi:hypothetical protein
MRIYVIALTFTYAAELVARSLPYGVMGFCAFIDIHATGYLMALRYWRRCHPDD